MYPIMCGDAQTKLLEIPDNSIQCCITSPPYWGLRDYGIKPTVWGGNVACEHEWAEAAPRRQKSADVKDATSKQTTNVGANISLLDTGFCSCCEAWRGSLGLEPTPELYVQHLVEIFREVKRVLKKDGTLWLVLGDSYVGSGSPGGDFRDGKRGDSYLRPYNRKGENLKPKDLVGIPWMVAFALRVDGWHLRSDIIWNKPNSMPESVKDRPTRAHEYIFLLTKSARYYYDGNAIKELAKESSIQRIKESRFNKQRARFGGNKARGYGTRLHSGNEDEGRYIESGVNKRDVWTITTKPFRGPHYAAFPPEIPEICIKAATKKGDTVLDPFAGSGTTLEIAERLGRHSIGIELNQKYVEELIVPRMASIQPLFSQNVI